jgi:hypothetical protein
MSGTASGPATRAGWRSPARVALLASFGVALGGAILVTLGMTFRLSLALAPPSEAVLAVGTAVVTVVALGDLTGGSAWWLGLGLVAGGVLELGRDRRPEAGPELAAT